MSACAPTRATEPDQNKRIHPPHSPSPAPQRRFHIAGADVSASIAVFLIALPLSLGIALATGAPLQAGLVAAAVGGLVAGRLGGSPLQVSGPAAGLTVVTADLIHRYGWRTTCAVTVLAGLAQLGLGCLRVARSALAVSPAIVHGMLAGIGVTIAIAQLHIVLGGTPQSSVLDNLRALPAQLAGVQPAAVTVSALTLTLLLLWSRVPGRPGRLLRRIPAALVAVSGATAAACLADLTLPKVDLPSWSSHALAGLPDGPVPGLVVAVLTTTLVCSVQSLLGAVAVDKLATARPGLTARVGRSDLDRELLGQGAANIVSGALGGLPVAGVAVRSSANVHAGAVSRNSTMLHGVLVVVAALLMVPVLDLIPLASLAALVMAVGIQMVSLHHIRTVTRHREVLVYAVTTLGVVFLGVLEGVALGVAVAVAVAMNRLARTHITHEEKDGAHHVHVRGQLTFLAVPRLSRALHLVPQGAHAVVELDGSFMDHAAYESLQDWQNTHTAQGGTAELTGRRAGVTTAEPNPPHSDHDTEPGTGAGTGRAETGTAGTRAATAGTGTGREGTDTETRIGRATGPETGTGGGTGTKAEPATTTGTCSDARTDAGAGSTAKSGDPTASVGCRCRPWTPWRNHQCERPQYAAPADLPTSPSGPGGLEGPDGCTGPNSHIGPGGLSRPTGLGEHGRPAMPTGPAGLDRPAPFHGPPGPGEPSGPGAPDRPSTLSDPTSPSAPTDPASPDGCTRPENRDDLGAAPEAPRSSADSNHPVDPVDPGTPAGNCATPDSNSTSPDSPGSPASPASPGSPGSPGSPDGARSTVAAAPATPRGPDTFATPGSRQLARGIRAFHRNTAPLVRGELARLAREGQRPSQLFLTCADSRLVTSMITSSGPGDLFVVRNVGNLAPLPGEESGDDSVAAAIEYAVDVLRVRSITVCGHSGCGAMQALLNSDPGGAQTPLKRWLRHGLPSLERMADDSRPWARLAGRAAADAVEQLCLTNVVQQLDHLRAHESVSRALRAGALELHGMYFHVGEAQAYLLTEGGEGEVFDHGMAAGLPA